MNIENTDPCRPKEVDRELINGLGNSEQAEEGSRGPAGMLTIRAEFCFIQDEIPGGHQASMSICCGAEGLMEPQGLGDVGVGTQESRGHIEYTGHSEEASGEKTMP